VRAAVRESQQRLEPKKENAMPERTTIGRRTFLELAVAAAGAAGLESVMPGFAGAAAKAPEKLGAQFIGKLEGPEIIRDVAKFPKKFGEAPMLAELVRAGKLPPVDKRLPDPNDLMVVKPLKEIGKYGGRWRRGFTGPADNENGNRIVSTDKILMWDYTGTKVAPALAKDWRLSDDGKVCTIFLRRGLKWSDGDPFTADDFVFWYEEIYQNKALVPTPAPEFTINGKPGRLSKRDDYTVVFEFPEPYFLFVDILAGDTLIGGGQATQMARSSFMGAYAPAHYLKQFLPKYSSVDEANRKAKAAGFDSWVSYLRNRTNWALNPDLPTVGPWKTVSPANTPTWALERNPYYWAVDTAGNQLPYIDRIVMTLAENLEVLNLRAVAGEYDLQERHTNLSKLPVFIENQKKGNYTLRLDPRPTGSDATLHVNTAFEADPEIAKWLKTRDFRRALSLGIDRDQINETFFLGVGTPGSTVPADDVAFNPGKEYRRKWATLDLKQANAMLDQMGLDKKDGEGYRLRTDGKGRLRIGLMTAGGSLSEYTQIAEMIKQQWRKIGIEADVREVERNLAFTRTANAEHHIFVWTFGGSENLFLYPRYVLPVDPIECHTGMPFARWYASSGTQGKKPDNPEMLRALELFRSAAGKKEAERAKIGQEIWKIVVEECWIIGTVGLSPAVNGVRLIKNNMGNIPARHVNAQHVRTPNTSHPATFFFKS
jgi:peptide/nickel transport system substrate-binding protein